MRYHVDMEKYHYRNCNWRAQSLRNLSLIAPSRSYTPRHLETATRTINHRYHRNVLEPQREKCFLLKGKQERRGMGGGGGEDGGGDGVLTLLRQRWSQAANHRIPLTRAPFIVHTSDSHWSRLFPPNLSKHADHWNEIMRRVPASGRPYAHELSKPLSASNRAAPLKGKKRNPPTSIPS